MRSKNTYTIKRFVQQSSLQFYSQYFQMETAQVSIDKRMYILWYIHTMEYCSALKMDKPSSMSSIVCGSKQSQVL